PHARRRLLRGHPAAGAPGPLDHDRYLAEHASPGQVGEVAQGAANDLLVRLGQLAAHHGAPPRPEGLREPGQSGLEPARRLEEDQRPRLVRELGEPAGPPPPPAPPGTPRTAAGPT